MVTEEIILISLCIVCALAIMFYSIYIDVLKIKENIRLIRRSDDILDYRVAILNKDLQDYYKLPTFKEMLYSDKPLEDEYWINK